MNSNAKNGESTSNNNGETSNAKGNGPTQTNDKPKGWMRRLVDWIGSSKTRTTMAALVVANAVIWAVVLYFNDFQIRGSEYRYLTINSALWGAVWLVCRSASSLTTHFHKRIVTLVAANVVFWVPAFLTFATQHSEAERQNGIDWASLAVYIVDTMETFVSLVLGIVTLIFLLQSGTARFGLWWGKWIRQPITRLFRFAAMIIHRVLASGNLMTAISAAAVLSLVIWVVVFLLIEYFNVEDELKNLLTQAVTAINIALSVFVFLALRFGRGSRVKISGSTSNDGVATANESDILRWRDDLGARARKLRRAAFAYLLLIFALFPVSIWAFIEAAEFVEGDSQTVASIQKEVRDPLNPLPVFAYKDVAVCGENVVVVGGKGEIRTSSDGGQTWTRPQIGSLSETPRIRRVAYSADCETVMAVGFSGVILVSTDLGETWFQPNSHSKTTGVFTDIALSENGMNAIAVGHISDREGVIRFSTHRGAAWRGIPAVSAPNKLYGVAMSADGKTVVAVGGDGIILSSSDGLQTWDKFTPDFARNQDGSSDSLLFSDVVLSADGMKAIAIGNAGLIMVGTRNEQIFEWQSVKRSDDVSPDFYTIELNTKATIAMAVNNRGTIRVGRAPFVDSTYWSAPKNYPYGTPTLIDIALSDDGQNAVAMGAGGAILVSTDRGVSWKTVKNSAETVTLYAVDITENGRTAFIVGENATILRLRLSDEHFPILEDASLNSGDTDSALGATHQSDKSVDPNLDAQKETGLLLQIYALRVGIMVFFFFMMNYLITLIRSNSRLAAFYDARRDTLVLLIHDREMPAEISIDQMKQIMQAFSPDDIDSQRPYTPSWIKQMLLRTLDTAKPERSGTDKS